jgi:putative FmdB family regulatory protein
MPLYEYHCPSCNHDVEILVRGSEQPKCPDCGGEKIQRLLSVVSAHVNGGGKPSGDAMPFVGCGKPACGTGACSRGMM